MPVYKYTASDDDGKIIKGKLDVADSADLQLKLKLNNLYLNSCELEKKSNTKALKPAVLGDFCLQLGSLLGAGVSMVRSLNIIADEDGLKPKLKNIYNNLIKEVRRGEALSDAMEKQGNSFPPLMINMFRSAEASGKMEITALKMADHYQKENKLNLKIKNAFTYPKILTVMIILVVTVIMTYVMPQFDELFSAMPALPLATRILFAISDFIVNRWWLLILIIACAVIFFRILFRIPKVKLVVDQLKIQLPGTGKLMKTIYTARFARTLSSLYACGISIVNCLSISKKVISNTYIESQFDQLIAYVRGGNSLSSGLAKIDGFVKKLSSSVFVGEESGNLEDLLNNMADNFEYESESALNKLVSYLEPIMIVIMAIIVAFIMIAVIMPIYDSYSYIG